MAEPSDQVWIEIESGALHAGNVEAFRLTLSYLRTLLSAQGLHLVTSADKRVLDAMAGLSLETLLILRSTELGKEPAEAELARRGEKA